ncbi:carboxymuconolactone decarboxylase family protein [Pseudonocardia sp. GCM10023141]|uniref:carboxymuconolactone decarboxylase family protein n=1 Tax=Pseudonocardia sp. GCM10023141 TaxID=3252653 RepID=UPI00361FCC43
MPRIPAVTTADAGVVGRLIYRVAARRYGTVPEPLAVARHHRGVFWASLVSELGYERASRRLPAHLRELAVYRVATLVDCSWCVDFGTMLQRLDGLDVERLTQIDSYATNPLFTPDERLVLAYADAMTALPITVTDAQVAELAAVLGRAGLVELTTQIALENMRARSNSALGIIDQGFDAACQVRASRD